MSENSTKTEQVDPYKGKSFFKCESFAGLTVHVPEGSDVRFVPYWVVKESTGDRNKVGFLATDDKAAIEILKKNSRVVEVKKEVYTEVVETFERAGI